MAIQSDPSPAKRELIEVYVAGFQHLFNRLDPSPVRQKDLSTNVEEFIVGWAREAHHRAQLALRVHVDRQPADRNTTAVLRDAVLAFFSQRAIAARRRLRQLMRVGRTSLLIGLAFLSATAVIAGGVEQALPDTRLGVILRESLLIGGWVAM